MIVTSNVLITHTLSLTDDERLWLLGFVQNSPLGDAARREKLFNALKDPHVNYVTPPALT